MKICVEWRVVGNKSNWDFLIVVLKKIMILKYVYFFKNIHIDIVNIIVILY